MQAISIAERRNITPAVKLNELLKSTNRKGAGNSKGANQSSQYHMDMNSRKLPPPLVLWSDNEKDAWIKNRNEQSRLNKVLDHLTIQENVCEQIFKKEASVMRTRNSKFQERVKGRMGPADQEESGSSSKDNVLEITSPEQTSATPEMLREYVSYRIETKHGVINKTMVKRTSMAIDTNVAKDTIADDTDESDMESLAASEDTTNSSSRAIRALSAANKHHQPPAHPFIRRTKSAFPVSRLPKLKTETLCQEKQYTIHSDGTKQPQSRTSGRKAKSNRKCGIFNSSFAVKELRRELNEMQKKRQERKQIVFDFKGAIGKERTQFEHTEKGIRHFYSKIKDMKNVPMSKWELKSIEGDLKLW